MREVNDWKDEEGEDLSSNWFKDHPRITFCLLVAGVIVLVAVAI